MRRAVIAAAVVLLAAPAWAGADSPAPQPAPPTPFFSPQLRGALQDLSRSLLGVLRALPRYEAPRIDDNGDIVIPRSPRPLFDPGADTDRPAIPGLIAV